MRFVHYPMVRFSICFALGTVIAHYSHTTFYVFPLLAGILGLSLLLWFFAKRYLIQKSHYGISISIAFFLLGCFNYQVRLPENRLNHYSNFISEDTSHVIHLKITEVLKEDRYSQKYFARIISTDHQLRDGKVLLNIQKDSMAWDFSVDDVLLFRSKFLTPPMAANPYQFDYARYLKTEHVYHQLVFSTRDIIQHRKGKRTVFGIAQNFRNGLIKKLRQTKITDDERGILQALILGEKKDISKELYQQYAAAGAVHILAVSGLHVGILFSILSFVFKPITRIKHGNTIRSLLIVVVLWAFAFLAGLSPSVMRAVAMFSFFAIALLFNRRTSGINTLALSFFTLLLLNPMNLFKVGFQLSYSAVFFILWLHPFFKRFTYSRFFLWRELKSIMTVTLAAQLGVLPLTLLYFHQFPGLFLLTNVVILPALIVFMVGGILVIVLVGVQLLPDWLATSYNFLVRLLNGFIRWIANHDRFLLQDVHFTPLKAIAFYFLIFSVGFFLMQPRRQNLRIATFGYIFLMVVFFWNLKQTSGSEVIIFHKSRESFIGAKKHNHLEVFLSDSTANLRSFPFITAYIAEKNIKSYAARPFPKALEVSGKTVVILDSLSLSFPTVAYDILLLTNNPKINFDRIPEENSPKLVIADGTNFPWYVARWEETLKKKKLPFHYTAKDGAVKIE